MHQQAEVKMVKDLRGWLGVQVKEMLDALLSESDMDFSDDVIEAILDKVHIIFPLISLS
jgi:hypothetical protein